jgi:hypothetical protein
VFLHNMFGSGRGRSFFFFGHLKMWSKMASPHSDVISEEVTPEVTYRAKHFLVGHMRGNSNHRS